MGEKISRLKLSRQVGGELGTFEALEALALGILGKRSLWMALITIAGLEDRIDTPDLEQLVTRSQSQYERVEERRLMAARAALFETSVLTRDHPGFWRRAARPGGRSDRRSTRSRRRSTSV